MKFSIRDLLLVTVIVALAVGWWREHLEVVRARREVLATERLYGEVRDRALVEAESANAALANTIAAYKEITSERTRTLPNSSAPAPKLPKE